MLRLLYEKFRKYPNYQRVAAGVAAGLSWLLLAGCEPQTEKTAPVGQHYAAAELAKFDYRNVSEENPRGTIIYLDRFNPPEAPQKRFSWWGYTEKSRNYNISNGMLRLNSNGIFSIGRVRDDATLFSNYGVEFDFVPLSVDATDNPMKLMVNIYPGVGGNFNNLRGYDLYIFPNGFEIAVRRYELRTPKDSEVLLRGKTLASTYFPWLQKANIYRVSFSKHGDILEAWVVNNGRKFSLSVRDKTYSAGDTHVSLLTPRDSRAVIRNFMIYSTRY